MQLTRVRIERFQNFMDEQTIDVEPDVTCLVGKNESGKTTILKALHRLKPANGTGKEFDLVTEYPRARLSRDRRDEDLDTFLPVLATFTLDEDDRAALATAGLAIPPTAGLVLEVGRTYGNGLYLGLEADFAELLADAASNADVHADDLAQLRTCKSSDELADLARDLTKTLKEGGEAARSKAVAALGREVSKLDDQCGNITDDAQREAVWARVPKFFYFSDYDSLPGKSDLHLLAEKIESGKPLSSRDQTVVALLEYAGEQPKDFLDEDFDSRKAELQAASSELSQKVFEYWKQNTDLAVVFDTDMPIVGHTDDPYKHEIRHRFLHVLLRDDRHGGVETNFETRSAGFQWFFSFLAAFSKYQGSRDPVVVLLDEPGTKLHGEAQKDFLRYIHEELGAEKQVLYTTHSQHMVDPSKYEKMRAVHDRATRDNVNAGVAVTSVDLSADRDTILPVEAALGYSVSQHLFFGSGHHLLVEGSSDFVFLQRMSDHLLANGEQGLDGRFAVIPAGGIDNFAPFVALMGRRFPLTALMDGGQSSRQYQRVVRAAEAIGISTSCILVCSDLVETLPRNADIEDLFQLDDYLWLYNRAIGSLQSTDLAPTDEPVIKRISDAKGKFDHALVAHELTRSAAEFFAQVRPQTLANFKVLFGKLAETLTG